MYKSLLDKFMLIIFNLLTNNIVKSNRDIVMHNNIIYYSCAKDNKIKNRKQKARAKAKKAIK